MKAPAETGRLDAREIDLRRRRRSGAIATSSGEWLKTITIGTGPEAATMRRSSTSRDVVRRAGRRFMYCKLCYAAVAAPATTRAAPAQA